MHCFHLLLLAFAAHAAPGPLEEREESTRAGDVKLSLLPSLIEPWPGYFEGKAAHESRSLQKRSLQKRSPVSAGVCRAHPSPPDGKGWLLKQAVCELQNQNRDSFMVDCVGKSDSTWKARLLPGQCGKGLKCSEFHGMNEQLEPAFDIICVDERTVREWFLDSTASHSYQVCSPHYVNDVVDENGVNMSLQVNVLDSNKLNRIPPDKVYFLLDGKTRIGAEGAHDPDVGSGIITVPPGSKIQACVDVHPGQAVWVVVQLAALAIVYCALGNCA